MPGDAEAGRYGGSVRVFSIAEVKTGLPNLAER
jgi:hypothetical protein